ncbi:MAG: Fic family protein [Fimbriimonadaceae bacterium]|nr:Fic family protein [Fimbriimonadaceae bacterium]
MIGQYIAQPAGYRAFIPGPFPPGDIELSKRNRSALETANIALGRLDGITDLLPDLEFFILMYIRKEAALSSQVEGTQATIVDALRAEGEMRSGLPDDVDDILRYVDAMNQGIERLKDLPLSVRLVREVHETLMQSGGRSHGHVMPGEFRTTQNWIGGASPNTARYVPPPPHLIGPAMGELEMFLHDPGSLPILIKAGLAHAQFETIHPFVDGNGRTGRLLVTFFLCERRILKRPVLYLSEYYRRNRDTYFDRLQAYHDRADVDGWLEFFLQGVAQVAAEATETVRGINRLREEDVPLVAAFGKNQETAMRLLRHLYGLPVVSVRNVERVTGLSRTNANRLVAKFVDAGILVQTDESVEYGRSFAYKRYLDLFLTSEA